MPSDLANCPRCEREAQIAAMVASDDGSLICAACGAASIAAARSRSAGRFAAAGCGLLVFGVGSLVLAFFGMNFKLLVWIDGGGPALGLALRATLILAGLTSFMVAAVQALRARRMRARPSTSG